MKILNLLASGGTGGIEVLCKNIAYYNENNNIDNYWCFIFSSGEIAEELKVKQNKKTYILKAKKSALLKIIKDISSIIKKERIDIVVIHHGGLYSNIIYLILKKIFKKKKFVRFLHSCYDPNYLKNNSFFYRSFYKKVLSKALNKSDLIISVSKAVESSHFFLINPEVKKCVVYNGIANSFYKKTIKSKTENSIIYVGRLSKEKGIDLLIKAFQIIKKEIPTSLLTIVGEGIERKKLEQIANNDSRIIFTGNQKEVLPFLDKSEIFVYPSTCEEAFGISVVESMARGCIPIAFKVGGISEIIDSGENGMIVKKIDYQSLAENIIKMFKSPIKEKLAKNAIRKSKEFSISVTIENINKEYEKIMMEN